MTIIPTILLLLSDKKSPPPVTTMTMTRSKTILTMMAVLVLLTPSDILFVDGFVATTTNVVVVHDDTRDDIKTWRGLRRRKKRMSSCSTTISTSFGILWSSLLSTTSIPSPSMSRRMALSATSPLTTEDGKDNDHNINATTTQPNSSSSPESRLLELLSPSSSCRVSQMSGTDLAYVGDVVYELFIRSRYVWPSKRTSDLQNRVVGLVRAEYQSKLLQKLRREEGGGNDHDDDDDEGSPGGFLLTLDENQVLMRGRNSVTRSSKNRKNPAAYQDSTAFECLIGYMYITNPGRCTELLSWLETIIDTDL